MTLDERTERYLKLVRWAQRRYTSAGWLTISIGKRATIYTRIERAAFYKYFPAAARE